MAINAYRTKQGTPDDPNTVLGPEMRAVGVAVLALLKQTKQSDPSNHQLASLREKLLNRGGAAYLSAREMRLAHQAVKLQKSSLLGKLADRLAYASPNTVQEYKENLFYIRKFEVKYREGIYIRCDITEPSG